MKQFLAGITLLLIITAAAFGDTLTVTNHDDSGPGSLRDTIAAAASGDTIVFDLPTPDAITLTTAALVIDKSLTIIGPGPDELTIARSNASGTPAFVVLDVYAGLTMSGLTITNGDGTMTTPYGGGMHTFVSAEATISDCHFTNNRGVMGGGFGSEGMGTGGVTRLTSCTFTGNVATISGGAVYVGGYTTLTLCTISENVATFGGGGIAVYDIVSLRDCTISDNIIPAEPDMGPGVGAGIYNSGYVITFRCTIANNRNGRGNGGGINSVGSQLDLSDSTLYGNVAQGDGGAIWSGGPTTLTDCTITNNTASGDSPYDNDLGGGGVVNFTDLGASVALKNTILAANHSSTHPDIVMTGTIPLTLSEGYNLIGDGTGGEIAPATGDQIGTEDAPIDPLLETLASNGGPTQTCALLAGSPAIDAGDPAAPAMDQRRYNRVDAPDIGAYELGATIPRTLANISTRLPVETGDKVLIGGFIVAGTHSKPVLLRAIGPSLTLDGKLADPVLEVHDSSDTVVAMNDDWETNANKQEIIDTEIPPTNPKESALLVTLDPGAYTAIIRGADGGTGIALVEAYDLDQTTDANLANISTRGLVQTGDNVIIGGFIVLGTLDQTVLIRAIGPSLPVAGSLADPILELHDADGGVIASNDNWRDSQEAEIEATGAPPTDDAESAILSTLAPGSYTAVVRGVGDTTGVALVEVYGLN